MTNYYFCEADNYIYTALEKDHAAWAAARFQQLGAYASRKSAEADQYSRYLAGEFENGCQHSTHTVRASGGWYRK